MFYAAVLYAVTVRSIPGMILLTVLVMVQYQDVDEHSSCVLSLEETGLNRHVIMKKNVAIFYLYY